jgi:hypothetical protein
LTNAVCDNSAENGSGRFTTDSYGLCLGRLSVPAMVLGAFSRKLVGWAMETHLRTELVRAA